MTNEEISLRAFLEQHVHDQFEHIPPLRRDRSLVQDHIVDMLCRFRSSETYNIFNTNGWLITTMKELLEDADPVYGTAPSFDYEWRRRVYIGDLILFFKGMLPEAIVLHPVLRNMDLDYLSAIAKENYTIASMFDLEEYAQKAPVFATLSTHFSLCEYGLCLVRQSIDRGKLLPR